jgi:hypothetical protein
VVEEVGGRGEGKTLGPILGSFGPSC